MGLFRAAVCLGAVLFFLPSDPQRQQQLVHNASDALVWGLTYCQRDPEGCERAQAIWHQMTEKAHFAAALATQLVTDYQAEREKEARAEMPSGTQPLTATDTGTLTHADVSLDAPGNG